MKKRNVLHRPFVSYASRLVANSERIILAELKGAGVTDLLPCHGDVLAPLYVKDGLTVTELATLTKRTKSTVSVIVDKLVKLGYVSKVPSVADARAVSVALTEKGTALKPVFFRVSEILNARFMAVLSEEEAGQLEGLLNRLVDACSER